MKKVILASASLMALVAVGCGEMEEPDYVAGRMTESTICSTSNLIVKNNLAHLGEYRTAHLRCSVRSLGGDRVQIRAGFEPEAAGSHELLSERRYVARGVVDGTTLRLEEIQVQGVDDDFIPMSQFP